MSPGDDADVADAKDGQDLRAEGSSYFHDREVSRAFGLQERHKTLKLARGGASAALRGLRPGSCSDSIPKMPATPLYYSKLYCLLRIS